MTRPQIADDAIKESMSRFRFSTRICPCERFDSFVAKNKAQNMMRAWYLIEEQVGRYMANKVYVK